MDFVVSQYGGVELKLFCGPEDESEPQDMLQDLMYFEVLASELRKTSDGKFYITREDFNYIREKLFEEVSGANEAIRNNYEYDGDILHYEPNQIGLEPNRYDVLERYFEYSEYAIVSRKSDEAFQWYPKHSRTNLISFSDEEVYSYIRNNSDTTGRVSTVLTFPLLSEAKIYLQDSVEPCTKIDEVNDIRYLNGEVFELVEQYWNKGVLMDSDVIAWKAQAIEYSEKLCFTWAVEFNDVVFDRAKTRDEIEEILIDCLNEDIANNDINNRYRVFCKYPYGFKSGDSDDYIDNHKTSDPQCFGYYNISHLFSYLTFGRRGTRVIGDGVGKYIILS